MSNNIQTITTGQAIERLPSGKFETNELVLELAILSYNILRMIGQESLGRRNMLFQMAIGKADDAKLQAKRVVDIMAG